MKTKVVIKDQFENFRKKSLMQKLDRVNAVTTSSHS